MIELISTSDDVRAAQGHVPRKTQSRHNPALTSIADGASGFIAECTELIERVNASTNSATLPVCLAIVQGEPSLQAAAWTVTKRTELNTDTDDKDFACFLLVPLQVPVVPVLHMCERICGM